MVKVVFEGFSYDIPEENSLLDGLLDSGAEVPHGCRTGTCQSCLLKCTEGEIPAAAQKGLRESQKLNRFVLACQCPPHEGMTFTIPLSDSTPIKARVQSLHRMNAEIMEVRLKPSSDFAYRAGQFIRLYNPSGVFRAYSLASVQGLDPEISLHVREYPGGHLSSWIHHEMSPGDEVTISDAMGECFYVPGKTDQPLLMIGTGSGLAPLYGILRDALSNGHEGAIHLFHGARTTEGLYLTDELNRLAAETAHFHYQPCVSNPEDGVSTPMLTGRATDIAFGTHADLKGWRVYLCGNPEMVRTGQMQAFLAGANLDEIQADPFDNQASS